MFDYFERDGNVFYNISGFFDFCFVMGENEEKLFILDGMGYVNESFGEVILLICL